jgi:hypothetical protein
MACFFKSLRARGLYKEKNTQPHADAAAAARVSATACSFKRHANSLEFSIHTRKKARKKERKKEIRRSKKFFTKLQALHAKKKKKLECGCVLQGLAVMKKAMY